MTFKRRVGALEGHAAASRDVTPDEFLSRSELEAMTLGELAALYYRREQRAASQADLSEAQKRIESMTEAELLSAYLSYGADL